MVDLEAAHTDVVHELNVTHQAALSAAEAEPDRAEGLADARVEELARAHGQLKEFATERDAARAEAEGLAPDGTPLLLLAKPSE